MVGRADDTFCFHPLDDAGCAIVTNLQMALHEARRGFSLPAHHGDSLYDQAVAIVSREGKASTSFVQSHLQIGYNKAAGLIDRMEKEGVISAANHVGKREVLVGIHSGD